MFQQFMHLNTDFIQWTYKPRPYNNEYNVIL